MSRLKKISPSNLKGHAWFECPYCFEVFEITLAASHHASSCGCLRAIDTPGLTPQQQGHLRWVKKEIQRERDLNIPPLLLKLVKPRRVDPLWDQEITLDARERIINEIGPQPENHHIGWKDPAGPICFENFKWTPD